MSMLKRIITFFAVFSILFSFWAGILVESAHADIYDAIAYNIADFADFLKYPIDAVSQNIITWLKLYYDIEEDDDGFNTSSGKFYPSFGDAYKASVSDTYGALTGYSNDGGLIWQTTFDDISGTISFCVKGSSTYLRYDSTHYPWPAHKEDVYNDISEYIDVYPTGYHAVFIYSGSNTSTTFKFSCVNGYPKFTAPVTGYYTIQPTRGFSMSMVRSGGTTASDSVDYKGIDNVLYSQGADIALSSSTGAISSQKTNLRSIDAYFYLPSFKIVPSTPTSSDPHYSTGTRIGSINLNLATTTTVNNITQIDHVYESTKIFNETNNTFYDPTTNTTYNVTNWNYDYDSRTYSGTTSDGTPFIVAYLDDLLKIDLGGQTIELHYVVEQEKPPACEHEYLANERTEPTCLEPGLITYVCRLCGTSYSETLDPLGHDYIMVDTIPDSYQVDEALLVCPGCNGTNISASQLDGSEMFQCVCEDCGEEWTVAGSMIAGYDLYRCSRCGVELRDYTHEGVDRSSSAYWSWLQKWLQNFKIWLGDKFDGLGGDGCGSDPGGGSGTVAPIIIAPHGEFKPNANIDIDLGGGELGATSLLAILGKFAWVVEVWEIGRFVVSTVASDAAYAYEFEYNLGEFDAFENSEDVDPPVLDGDSVQAPELTIDFGAASSKYGFDTGGSVKVFDLSWYTPYKHTVDNILSGFLWIFFLWQLFKKTPGIISGSSMDSQKLEDIANGERRR